MISDRKTVTAAASVNSEGELQVFFSIFEAARSLAEKTSSRVTALVWGENPHEYACRISGEAGIDVYAFKSPDGAAAPEQIAGAALELAKLSFVSAVLFEHRVMMCAAAACAAFKSGGECITGAETLDSIDGTFCITRHVFNGKISARHKYEDKQLFVTVMPGNFRYTGSVTADVPGRVKEIKVPESGRIMQITGSEKSSPGDAGFESADVIVAVGRGAGSRENIDEAKKLMKIFRNPALGASRIVCDRDWLAYAHQVGVTGRTVSPKLYLALGISGARQHTAGMRDSSIIVSVNTDPDAAISDISDYIVTEDMHTFIPLLIEEYEKNV